MKLVANAAFAMCSEGGVGAVPGMSHASCLWRPLATSRSLPVLIGVCASKNHPDAASPPVPCTPLPKVGKRKDPFAFWDNVSEYVRIDGVAVLNGESTFPCVYGGTIRIVLAGTHIEVKR